ncbi:MAG: hypothetical protein ACREQI_04730 [Candidatus Binataceae bacterium]
MHEPQRKFLLGEFMTLTIGGALQRASVYSVPDGDPRREQLRHALRDQLNQIAESYKAAVTENAHLENITRLANTLTENFRELLDGGRFRIGIAQKALNPYLKYLWCPEKSLNHRIALSILESSTGYGSSYAAPGSNIRLDGQPLMTSGTTNS